MFNCQTPDSDNDPEKLKELCGMLMCLPDDALRQMPSYLKRDIKRLAEAGMLPAEVAKRLNRLNV